MIRLDGVNRGSVTGAEVLIAGTYTGNDSVTGGAFDDSLSLGSGANRAIGLAGNDTITLSSDAMKDIVDGGAGNDLLRVNGTAAAMTVDLGTTGHVLIKQGGATVIDATSVETLNLYGGFGKFNDRFIGLANADILSGFAGDDVLYGGAGLDTLNGGADNDILMGGAGADQLSGELGDDTFRFLAVSDSAASAADLIQGFDGAGAAGGDVISLVAIDAKTGGLANDRFTFGSVANGGLSLVNDGVDTLLRLNTDSDAAFEFVLRIVDGAVLSSSYSASDFIL